MLQDQTNESGSDGSQGSGSGNSSGDGSGADASGGGGEISLDPSIALERIDGMIDGIVRAIPNLIIAAIIFLIFWFIAKFVKSLIKGATDKTGRTSLGEVLGRTARALTIALGFFIAATVVVPSLDFGTLISGLGISSVAIGFAFRDILQNWLAGVLILLRQPFQLGDQIEVNGHEGTVKKIETRATIIKTYDGQQIIVPNSEIYTNSVVVRTGYDVRRTHYDIGVGYEDDLDEAKQVILDAIKDLEGVETDPAPEALTWDLAASWINIRARWWTKPDRSTVVHTKARVILAVKQALDEAGIDMPFETLVHMYRKDDLTTTNRPPRPIGFEKDEEGDESDPGNPAKGDPHDGRPVKDD